MKSVKHDQYLAKPGIIGRPRVDDRVRGPQFDQPMPERESKLHPIFDNGPLGSFFRSTALRIHYRFPSLSS